MQQLKWRHTYWNGLDYSHIPLFGNTAQKCCLSSFLSFFFLLQPEATVGNSRPSWLNEQSKRGACVCCLEKKKTWGVKQTERHLFQARIQFFKNGDGKDGPARRKKKPVESSCSSWEVGKKNYIAHVAIRLEKKTSFSDTTLRVTHIPRNTNQKRGGLKNDATKGNGVCVLHIYRAFLLPYW